MHDISQNIESDGKTASILRNKLNAAADKVIRLDLQMSLYRNEERKASQHLETLRRNDAEAPNIEEAENNWFNAGQMLPSAQSRLATAVNELRLLLKKAVEYLPSDDDAMQHAVKASNAVDL
ncbi:hypothetical protein M407DRAFT_34445 [Tulasnella calospora MUT 4182]|uniref:Tubulin-specific chaperone A n=1 Tax=Tulasnella calospora MUT 4182 TaxID=1051891 RepID=A0A0C3Q1A2_9AGAM|nr:hypothetical protein M407DRAFT_34445 [Tulasnella calospora MUT 4182]